ncbi:MAG: metallophosphoesterase [Eubacterium sp.]|nr:metallophosphoesterase [Eubacterium sp.]
MKYLIIAIILLVIIAVFLYYQNNKLDVTRYKIESDDIKNRLRIVHLSDLHSKPFYKALETIKAQKPDIIVITGDYINDKGRRKDKMLDFGKELISIAPVYYITGNHERRLDYFDELMNDLRSIGFNVLLDEITSFEINGSTVNILGLDENQASFEDYKARKAGTFVYKDVSPLINDLCRRDGFKIVLSHFPENFELVKEMDYVKYPFDIQLSGHAHGGQFILPFIGPVLSPGQGLFPKYARGSFGTRPMLIISRGLGNAEFPFRLFNHPEIVVITATKKISEDSYVRQ